MNPWPVVIADLRALRWVAWVVPMLVAITVAVGVAVSAQEAALRRASAHAADDFDLLIGGPGSQTQLVLTAIYLQPAALPLIDGSIVNALASDARVRAAAPIAFGGAERDRERHARLRAVEHVVRRVDRDVDAVARR